MAHAGTVRIGISGWTYVPWRGEFYPKGVPQKRELEYAAGRFRSLEINGTFYGMQRPDVFADWADRVPENFVFAVKAPRYITHMRRLRDAATPLANFIASGLLRLGAKLGPILWQLPPNFRFDVETIEDFLKLLPHDTCEAVQLGRRHDDRLKAPAWLSPDADYRLRHAFEIRNETFRDSAFIDLLRKYDVALVCADTAEWPRLMDVTSDFVYCRLHGPEELYASGYNEEALDEWSARIVTWARGGEPEDADRVAGKGHRCPRDVFVYFDNDAKVRAPFDAMALTERVTRLLAVNRSHSQISQDRAARTSESSRSKSSATRGTRKASAP
jgi:uncharacterized protein YecE (DUF72 family)